MRPAVVLPMLAFLAAFVAFLVLPLPFETTGAVLVAAALGALEPMKVGGFLDDLEGLRN